MTPQFELIEHTADIFVKAYGPTVADAFGAAAEAMFILIVDEAPIAETEERRFEIESIDCESLLVSFLSELIAIHEIDGLVFNRCEVAFVSENGLTARLFGEKFNPDKHRHGLMFKAVSYHLMEIAAPTVDQPAFVKVLFDI